MMFQSQLRIKSIENIQRKSGEMSLSFLEQKSTKKIRRSGAKNTSKKQKTGKGESASFCDLTRACVCFSSASRGVRAPENSRARVHVCVYCVLREVFKLQSQCDREDTDFQIGNERRKKMRCNKRKKRQFLRPGEKQFHFTSLSFVMKRV